MSLRNEQCNKVCRILDDVLANRPTERDSLITAVRKAFGALETEPQWIPCSEVPDSEKNVFIARGTEKFKSVCVGHYEPSMNLWYEDKNWFASPIYDALYYTDIPDFPEPYREEGGE